jgi:hypothetical protein
MTRNEAIELPLFRKQILFGLALATLILPGCEFVEFAADVRGYLREGYVIEGGNVLWAEQVIKGADASTFEVSTRHGLPLPWGRDKDRAIHEGSIIPGSHGPSFQAFSRDWAKDRDHVYFGSTAFTNWELRTKEAEIRSIELAGVTVLESMDPATFRLIKDTGSIRSRYSDVNDNAPPEGQEKEIDAGPSKPAS